MGNRNFFVGFFIMSQTFWNRMNNNNIVILGGSGFLGRELIKQLLNQNYKVKNFDINEYLVDTNDYEMIIGDVCDYDSLVSVLSNCTVVFHLVSIVYVGLDHHKTMNDVNIEGVRNVLKACEQECVQYLIYTSSCDVVFDGNPKIYANEECGYPDESEIYQQYVRTKIEAEKMVISASKTSKLKTCSLRPTHMYGPNDPHAILQSLKSFKIFPFRFGNGESLFDVVYIGNVAHAHIQAYKQLQANPDIVNGQCYFINENNFQNYYDFIRPYAELKNIKIPSIKLPYFVVWLLAVLIHFIHFITSLIRKCGIQFPKFDPDFNLFVAWIICKHFFFNSEKARKDLGYMPIFSPVEGLIETKKWLKQLR